MPAILRKFDFDIYKSPDRISVQDMKRVLHNLLGDLLRRLFSMPTESTYYSPSCDMFAEYDRDIARQRHSGMGLTRKLR